MLNYKKPKFWVIFSSIIIVIAVGIGLAANPNVKVTSDLDQIGPNNIEASVEEVPVKQPEKSAAQLLSDLANHQFVIKQDQISTEDYETIVTFGKAFVNLYSGAVAEQEAVSFENYISNENLHTFINRMLGLEQRRELNGGFAVHFSLDNEFQEAELKKLDENLYYLGLPFSSQGSGRNSKLLVHAENKLLRIVDFYFGTKDGVDTFATGHPSVRKLDNPKLWDDQKWLDGVYEKLGKYE